MDSKKLLYLIDTRYGDLKGFSEYIGVKYTTLWSATRSDDKVDNMNVSMFIKIAHGLDMSADWLIHTLEGGTDD